MTLKIYLETLLKITLNFFPAILIALVGLIYLYFDERRDKQKEKTSLAATRKGQ